MIIEEGVEYFTCSCGRMLKRQTIHSIHCLGNYQEVRCPDCKKIHTFEITN